MLQLLNKQISALRSNLLMGKYEKIYVHLQAIHKIVPILKHLNLSPQYVEEISRNIEEEVEIAHQIIQLLEPTQVESHSDEFDKYFQEDKEVGKWGSKSKKWKKKESPQKKAQHRIDSILNIEDQLPQIPQKIVGTKLSDQDYEQLEREFILPLTLPDLFKKKTPSQIIKCPAEMCDQILSFLSESLMIEVIQLKSCSQLLQHINNEAEQQNLKLFISSLPSSREKSQILNKAINMQKTNNIFMFVSSSEKRLDICKYL